MSGASSSNGFPRAAALLSGVVLWGLVGCQTSPSPGPAPGPAAPSAEPRPSPGAGVVPANAREFRVVAADSLLQVFVYRGGAMARLGHNHVIASHALTGTVWLTDDPTQTRFDVQVPVDDLTVDEPELRTQAGPDFPPNVPQGARDGTRGNLLSPALLDGARFPVIRLRATDVVATASGYDVGVEITIKDATRLVRVPVAVDRQGDALMATAEFPLRQSDLGLKPFSVAMGTLVVLDDMRVRLRLAAKWGHS